MNFLDFLLGMKVVDLLRGDNSKSSSRATRKTAADWENEVRAHELKQDINFHYETRRAEADLQRARQIAEAEIKRLQQLSDDTENGPVVTSIEYNGKGGYKVSYSYSEPRGEEAHDAKKTRSRKTT
jgi:hypothetical protein